MEGGLVAGQVAAQGEGERPGPWLLQGWPCGAAAGEGGRRVNRLEVTQQSFLGLLPLKDKELRPG